MKQYARVDLVTGMFVEDVILDATILEGGTPDPAYIATPCPPGFYWPCWDGEKWVEGGTAPEPIPPEPTDIAKLQAENAKLSEMLAQTNADFAGFMDYYFSVNPE